jgi:hypothetical protein
MGRDDEGNDGIISPASYSDDNDATYLRDDYDGMQLFRRISLFWTPIAIQRMDGSDHGQSHSAPGSSTAGSHDLEPGINGRQNSVTSPELSRSDTDTVSAVV